MLLLGISISICPTTAPILHPTAVAALSGSYDYTQLYNANKLYSLVRACLACCNSMDNNCC